MLDPIFNGAGLLADSYERVDWATTPLGPVESWSPTLRNTLSIALNCKFAITLLWGPQFVLLYNEAYAEMIADKHPAALGSVCADVFPEAWDEIGPLLADVRDRKTAVWQENSPMRLHRHGLLEDAYFTYSYSPITNESGEYEGVIDIASETTAEIISMRRLVLLTELGQLAHELKSPDDLVAAAMPMLKNNIPDIADVNIVMPDAASMTLTPELIPDNDIHLVAGPQGNVAWLRLTGAQVTEERPLLAIRLSDNLEFDLQYANFLQLVAAALGNAWSLAVIRAQERSRIEIISTMSEALQRSLLTAPPQPSDIDIAVRYVPAAQEAAIGGDWYDAFTSGGITSLVIGDVAGHDQMAAAVMGQVRNLLRGIAYSLGEPPARVLTELDGAMQDLGINATSTAVYAAIDRLDGPHVLRWSNAGHPPPVLITPEGHVSLLETEPNLLLGVEPTIDRDDHELILPSGSTVIMYSDGLIERRSIALADSLRWLVNTVEDLGTHDLNRFCDALLGRVTRTANDDIALVAARIR